LIYKLKSTFPLGNSEKHTVA